MFQLAGQNLHRVLLHLDRDQHDSEDHTVCVFMVFQLLLYSYSCSSLSLCFSCVYAAGGSTADELSASDLELLRSWINPAYLKAESWAKIAGKMDADGSVQLQRFLLPEVRFGSYSGKICHHAVRRPL